MKLQKIAKRLAQAGGACAMMFAKMPAMSHDMDQFRNTEAYLHAKKAAHYAFIILGRPENSIR